MSTTTEQNSHNRRQRRSSITQHLQRMFHNDKQNDKRQRNLDHTPYKTEARPSSDQQSYPAEQFMKSSDYLNNKSSDISSNAQCHNSHSSLSSKVTGLNNLESRHSSLQSFGQELQSPPTESTVKSQPDRIEIGASQTWGHSSVQRKDRRATKRLEAERVELEKRLLKLEEAERTGDVNLLKRESRRLSKKQPLGSSSRSSSASGDESRPSSRPPSRLSSIFSSSRRRSRSRSSSIEGNDSHRLSTAEPKGVYKNEETQSTTPALSMTLPERLGVAISKELEVKNSALFPYTDQSIESLHPGQPGTLDTDVGASKHSPHIKDKLGTPPYQPEPAPNSTTCKEGSPQPNFLNSKDLLSTQTDLDRESFTATLISGKRGYRKPNSINSNRPASRAENQRQPNPTSFSKGHTIAEVGHDDNTSVLRSSPPTSQSSLPRSTLSKSLTDSFPQRNHRKFKSSPLAESLTVNNNHDSLPETKAATSQPNAQNSDPGNQTSISINRSQTFPWSSSQGPSKRNSTPAWTSASNSGQNASPAVLTKPRFYTSLGGVSNPSNDIEQNKEKAAVDPRFPLGRSSVGIYQENTKQDNQDPSRYAKSVMQQKVSSQRPRLSSGLSSQSLSQDSESDYNTADESTSIASASEDVTVRSPRRADINASGASKRTLASPSHDNFVPTPTTIPSPEVKKSVADTKQPGRDQLVAKLFVICCHCKFWHDMPSAVYARLAYSNSNQPAPDRVSSTQNRKSISTKTSTGSGIPTLSKPSSNLSRPESIPKKALPPQTTTPSTVECCWCQHYMSKQCCQGWTTVVHMHQRHH